MTAAGFDATPKEILQRIDDGFFAVNRGWQVTFLNDRAATLLDVTEIRGESPRLQSWE